MKKTSLVYWMLVVMLLPATACKKDEGAGAEGSAPKFTLAWSKYPSWSALAASCDLGIVNCGEGQSDLEKRHAVDLILKEADYGTTIQMYSSGNADAVCITNTDILSLAGATASTAILANSTSFGGDKVIVADDITTFDDLKGVKVYGLDQSVSRYVFDRCLEVNGKNPADYTFVNQDPIEASMAMQQGHASHRAIVAWNPEATETLKRAKNVHALCDSTKIPGEVIDMVVMSNAALAHEAGKKAASAVVEAYYTVLDRLDSPFAREATLTAVTQRFSDLPSNEMNQMLTQTKCFKREEGVRVFSEEVMRPVMEKILAWSMRLGIVSEKPTDSQLKFETRYMLEAGH